MIGLGPEVIRIEERKRGRLRNPDYSWKLERMENRISKTPLRK
jgi:hypothetical protein